MAYLGITGKYFSIGALSSNSFDDPALFATRSRTSSPSRKRRRCRRSPQGVSGWLERLAEVPDPRGPRGSARPGCRARAGRVCLGVGGGRLGADGTCFVAEARGGVTFAVDPAPAVCRARVGCARSRTGPRVHHHTLDPRRRRPGSQPSALPVPLADGVEPERSRLHSMVRAACHWNCAKNLQISALVQVVTPLSLDEPSTGPGMWPPSKAAHWTGYPARQPE